MRILILCLLLGATAAAFAADRDSAEALVCNADGECAISNNKIIRPYGSIFRIEPVERRQYDDPNQPFAAEIAALGRPIVVRSAMLQSKWKAFDKWNNAYMITAMCPASILHPVYITKNHTFWLHRSHSDIYDWDDAPKPYEQTNMTVHDFFLRLHDPTTYGHFYYSEPVERLTKELAEDVSPFDFLSPFPEETRPQVQPIWLGSHGVTTQLHYDTNFNFHVQIDGHKSFLLFPPEALLKAYLFPRIHPHHRRSQVDLDAVDPSKFPTFSAEQISGVTEVTLNPGDALYLPPFWGHHVTNKDGGISVNVWTDHTAFKTWSAEMFKMLLSVPKTLPPQHRIRAFTTFIRLLLSELKLEASHTMRELYTQRYQLVSSDENAIHPNPHSTDQEKQQFDTLDEFLPSCKAGLESLGALPASWKTQLEARAKQVAAKVQSFHHAYSQATIQHLILLDYLDTLALNAVSSHHQLVGQFISKCF